jgi:hypothetical protein
MILIDLIIQSNVYEMSLKSEWITVMLLDLETTRFEWEFERHCKFS